MKSELSKFPWWLDESNSNQSDTDEKEVSRLLARLTQHKEKVLSRMHGRRLLLKDRLLVFDQILKSERKKLKEIKYKIAEVDDLWCADFIAAQILLQVRKMLSTRSLRIMGDKERVHGFNLPMSKGLKKVIRIHSHQLTTTKNRVNKYLKQSKIKFVEMNDDGYLKIKFV